MQQRTYLTSASAKLVYGNFGTGTATTAWKYAYGNEFDFTITGSGEAWLVLLTQPAMTMDEGGADDTAANLNEFNWVLRLQLTTAQRSLVQRYW